MLQRVTEIAGAVGLDYDFDKVDCAQLFAAEIPVDALQTPGPSRH